MISHIEQGIQLEEQERYQEAIAEYDLALLEEPRNPEPLIKKGALLNDLGEFEPALQALTGTLNMRSGDYVALVVRGDVYSSLKQYKEAIADFTEAISIDGDDVDSHYNRGLAYANIGLDAQAIQDFTEAIRIDPLHGGA